MLTVKKEYLFDQMRKTKSAYWEAYEGNKLVQKYTAETPDTDESINELDELISAGSSGHIAVKYCDISNMEKAKGNVKSHPTYEFRIACGETTKVAAAPDMSLMMIIDQLKRDILENKHNQQIKDLRDEMDEKYADYEFENEGGLNGMIKQITPSLPLIIAKITGINIPTATLSGHEEIIVEDSPEISDQEAEQKKKCAQACGLLLYSDKNAGDHLLQLAILSKNKPEVYKMALSYLKTL